LGCLFLIAACADSQTKPQKTVKALVSPKATRAASSQPRKLALKPQTKPVAASKQFDQNLAWEHLIKQVAFGPRVPGTEAHAKTAKYIFDEMNKYCDGVREQGFSYRWPKTGQTLHFKNLIGTQNWQNSSIRVVLTTHWDSRPQADNDPNVANQNKPVPAANDGASGVAVILELMRVLKKQAPTVGIMYFINDGEDLGPSADDMFLGARVFAEDIPKMRPKPTYGILLDMIGDKDLSIPMEPGSVDAAPDLMMAFYRHAKSIGLGATFPMVPGDRVNDDHLPLIEKGLPTIDLIDFNYPEWHTVNDTPEYCSAESLGKVGKMLQSWFTMEKPWRPGMG
jgi:glutaminyl-peptide cyclotransferase